MSHRTRVTSLCALTLTLLICTAPAVAHPGSNGDVLCAARHGATNGLYLRHGDRAQLLRLDADLVPGAVFSPRGRRIALPRRVDGRALWIIDANGNDLRRVTPVGTFAVDPSWSPDGAELAFTGGHPAKRHVFAIGADGTGMRALTRGKRAQFDPPGRRPGGSPTSSAIAAAPTCTRRAAGGGKRSVTAGRVADSAPSWSPDGRRLAYVRAARALWLVGAHGSGAHRVIGRRGLPVTAPAWSPDGRWLLFSAGRPGAERVWMVHPDGTGRGAHRPRGRTAGRRTGRPWASRRCSWRPATSPAPRPAPVRQRRGRHPAASAGQLRTSDLLLRADLDAVLAVGDIQYDDGEPRQFTRSFGPTWGRGQVAAPAVPGNHEYAVNPTATPYFDYFDGVGARPARPASGPWAVTASTRHLARRRAELQLQHRVPGGCDRGVAAGEWLRADLAAHPAGCTLAYWHHPRFGSAASDRARRRPLWQALYDNGADVVLSGHHHLYERMSPQDPAGGFDPQHGIREFIVGTGGKSLVGTSRRSPNTQVLDDSALGVLELDLRRGGYHWRFHSASSSPFADSGDGACH